MTMAPFEATSQELQEIFKETQELQKTIQEKHLPNMPMTELSMGMSRDFKESDSIWFNFCSNRHSIF